MKKLFIKLVRGYQKFLSPILPKSCRYYPTCSQYMIDAIEARGAILGIVQGTARVLRCNPFVRGGVDPVGEHFTIFRNKHPEDYEDEIVARYVQGKKEK